MTDSCDCSVVCFPAPGAAGIRCNSERMLGRYGPFPHQFSSIDVARQDGDYAIAGQPGLQNLNLKFEKPHMRVSAGRPRLAKHDQQRHQPSWLHQLCFRITDRKFCIYRCPTFWTTPRRLQGTVHAGMTRRGQSPQAAAKAGRVGVLRPDTTYGSVIKKLTSLRPLCRPTNPPLLCGIWYLYLPISGPR